MCRGPDKFPNLSWYISQGESRVVRAPRRNENATLSGHALGVRLAERNASTSKMLPIIVIALRRNPSVQRQPSHSLTRPLPSEPLSYRLANPQAKSHRSSDSSSLGLVSI